MSMSNIAFLHPKHHAFPFYSAKEVDQMCKPKKEKIQWADVDDALQFVCRGIMCFCRVQYVH